MLWNSFTPKKRQNSDRKTESLLGGGEGVEENKQTNPRLTSWEMEQLGKMLN